VPSEPKSAESSEGDDGGDAEEEYGGVKGGVCARDVERAAYCRHDEIQLRSLEQPGRVTGEHVA
jgi:hypothetical protein